MILQKSMVCPTGLCQLLLQINDLFLQARNMLSGLVIDRISVRYWSLPWWVGDNGCCSRRSQSPDAAELGRVECASCWGMLLRLMGRLAEPFPAVAFIWRQRDTIARYGCARLGRGGNGTLGFFVCILEHDIVVAQSLKDSLYVSSDPWNQNSQLGIASEMKNMAERCFVSLP